MMTASIVTKLSLTQWFKLNNYVMSQTSPQGVTNFKKGIEKIRPHEDTRLHCISLAQWKSFQQRLLHGQTIDAEFQRQLETDREKTLLILDRIFSVTLFLALQEISFRGHRFESQAQMSSFENSGNYLELLQLWQNMIQFWLLIFQARSQWESTLLLKSRIKSSARYPQ